MTTPCCNHQLPDGWVSLSEAVRRTNPAVDELMRRLAPQFHHQLACFETRRTVQVATRKYRARKGRR